MLAVSGDLGRGFVYLREAEALAAAAMIIVGWDQVFVFLSFYFFLMGAYDQTIAAAQRALALAAGELACTKWRTSISASPSIWPG